MSRRSSLHVNEITVRFYLSRLQFQGHIRHGGAPRDPRRHVVQRRRCEPLSDERPAWPPSGMQDTRPPPLLPPGRAASESREDSHAEAERRYIIYPPLLPPPATPAARELGDDLGAWLAAASSAAGGAAGGGPARAIIAPCVCPPRPSQALPSLCPAASSRRPLFSFPFVVLFSYCLAGTPAHIQPAVPP